MQILRAEKYLPPPPRAQEKKSSEAKSGSIHPYGRYGNAVKTRKTISTIAILWSVKTIFEKRAATVEVDTFVSPCCGPFGPAPVPRALLKNRTKASHRRWSNGSGTHEGIASSLLSGPLNRLNATCYLCFTPSTAIGLPLRWGVCLGGPISPYLASTHR